ncbi:DUF3800 domain-containing protein [Tepidibacter hydrothermalis]|uniref:DUF3800 domain-containing protein n=1 Tax=Tepidibacter hydrothermalis TaxID=3036126 RepID=A0ABY8EJR3_9FIRM|nr:DUF3800 domain-containing protein [Tepidibacter hydrothermalis]WFD11325.1 DUF3800 domain-containing protein [Tepidibacter hydrothermalis]
MRIKFFCDESGNTGNNFLDEKDPFFVLGGWLDKCNNSSNIEFIDDIACILESAHEIKSTKLIKSSRGRRKIKSVIECMVRYDYLPFFSIVHKKFAIAARVVDVLLDPEYNNMVSRKITYNEDALPVKKYAEIIYKLSDYVLSNFAEAYRYLDYNLMCQSIELISKELKEINEIDLSNKVFNSKILISDNLNDEIGLEKNQAPNIFSLYTLFQILDNYGTRERLSIDFIHDNQKEYRDNMNNISNLFFNDRNDKIRYAFKQRKIFFNSIKSLSFEDSKNNTLIQCADITVGTVNYILKKLIFNKSLDNIDRELLTTLKPYIISWGNPQLTHFMIAEETFQKWMNYF